MGSWYNLIGEDLTNCISTKCGQRPAPPSGITVTPQAQAEYNAKLSAWNTCRESCEKARFNLAGVGTLGSVNTSGVTPLGGLATIAPTRETGNTPVMDTRPLEKQDGSNLELTGAPKGLSKNTILIGVGVLAVVAFFAFRK